MRVAIVGNSGPGKSALAGRLTTDVKIRVLTKEEDGHLAFLLT